MCKGIIALAVLLAGGECVRNWWFSSANDSVLASAALTVDSAPAFVPERLNSESSSGLMHHADLQQEKIVDRLLGHDRSRCGVWQDKASPGLRVQYTWVEYDAGNPRYLKDLFGHPPEVCVGKSGATQIAIHPNRKLSIGDREVPVRHVEFADPISGTPFQIFKFTWLSAANPLQVADSESERDLRSARLSAAWHGMPQSDARMMIAVVFGVDGAESGWQQFRRTVAASLPSGVADEAEQLVENRVGD